MKRPPFDLWQLLCVRAIAEHGSIHGAARFLNIRQSAVSRSLHNLEERLNVRLFTRSPAGAAPTAFGREFVRWSQTILDNVASMNARARRTGKGENGQISIGIQTCVLPGKLSAFTAEFRATYRDIVFRYSEGTGKRLLRRLQRGQIDFAVITRSNLARALRIMPLWSDRIVAALPAGHPLTTQPEVSWTDVRHEIFLIGRDNAGQDFERLIQRKLGETGIGPKIRRHDIGSNRIVALVQNHEGIALLPASWLPLIHDQHGHDVTIMEIRDAGGSSHLEFGIVWRPDNENPCARSFAQYLESHRP
ncbi:LysR family transcriptional regulator [Komagataeibacter oboediens]|uniref:LysR family transcriptional regulator n=1 Tax=Komagataeibacter oboediens TaxID=65958 RepID=A0ABS5SQB4_9PROT|nr:LysR family transcriptional regulator [Komagataeibacter oboediens]MBL7234748.1 LysR family transcriptional regulator [Komagataeibacter oboediens]MBT0676426.1 LysR family transcriptional regulator [Komagataeibacter oboediens]MBT0679760.1 LysR family transcriptional regulator [Komagataeibacter oboediens]